MPPGVPTFAKFNEVRQNKYLAALRRGVSRGKAARQSGVSAALVCLYRQAHPEFASVENDAEDEATDAVENALHKAAIAGNVTACQVWLYNRRPERWKDQRNLKVLIADDELNRAIESELARLAGRCQAADAQPSPTDADAGQEQTNGQPAG